MGARVRAFDWSQTPLGPIGQWPESLRFSVRSCLNCRFPMYVWWGPDLTYIYNDAHIAMLGHRHPDALGRPARTIWAELWPAISRQLDSVFQGTPSWNERAHLVVTRNGFPEDTWFTWSYTPIHDGAGKIAGLHCITIDETARVLGEKSRHRLADRELRAVADNSARTILESINEAFFSLDEQWRFTYMNPQSFVLLGRQPEELIGKSLWDEYPGLRGGPFEPVYREVAATRKAGSLVAFFPDHRRWYDVRAYPAEDGGLSIYFSDVTQQKLASDEREKLLESERVARSDAERAGRLKDEFLATLSHELRTPLNAVLGWCDILSRQSAQDPGELSEGLRTIERNARAQAQIIADILDMSSIIAGKMRLAPAPLDLATVIRDALESVRPAASVKGIEIRATYDSLPVQISGDQNRLQQVFWNILSNAVKFTPKGGSIDIRLARVESHVQVTIADSGMGIRAEFLPFVFDRFRQADASTTRRFGGLGLGLSIVKQLVELHGGTITVASAGEGRGSTFTMELPVRALRPDTPALWAEAAQPGASAAIDEPERNILQGIKVLAVDDEADARQVVRRLLEDYGATVIHAGSASEAFDLLKLEAPNVMFSDIGMPDEDGYSLLRRVRNLPAASGGDTPALALTAYARPADQDRAIVAGFQMHLSKPVEPADLIRKVAALARVKLD